MKRIILALALPLASLAIAGAAHAQTSPCKGAAPSVGQALHGPVLHVLDGRTLCVATGTDPSSWVAVTLADAPQEASWGALMGVAFGRDVTCTTQADGAVCRADGRSVGAQLREPDAAVVGTAWRQGVDPAPRAVPVDGTMRVASAR